ncbi:MAG: FAD:protein FMN transferase [Planctomyces sp.]
MSTDPANPTRRELLSAFRTRTAAPSESARIAGPAPNGGATVRLTARLMGCDFTVVLNPGPEQVEVAGEALERISAVEAWLSHYRDDSQLSRLNQTGWPGPASISAELRDFLEFCRHCWQLTDGAFDVAAGALSQLWRHCRKAGRIPDDAAVAAAKACSGHSLVNMNPVGNTVCFSAAGISLDPGAVGKGWGLDDAAAWLLNRAEPLQNFLLSGGHSSLLAAGSHNGTGGWPVGLGNPLFTEKRIATILLMDQAMGTSGSNIQFFRHAGRRYGHILDPRTGWPAEGMLSATVLADSAALADALSTAFFVMGVEKAVECCRQIPDIAAILIPFPDRGTRLSPVVVGNLPHRIWWDAEQAAVQYI